ncbi:MAG: O-antigen ligase family protein [Patescibacteria group bacterium]
MVFEDIKKDFIPIHFLERMNAWKWWACAAALFVAACSAYFGVKGLAIGLGAIVAGLIMLAIIRAPWTGIVVIAFALPFERFGSIDISGFTVRASQVILGVTLVVVCVYLLAGKLRIRFRGAHIALALFVVGACLSLPHALNLFRATTSLGFMIFTALLAFAIPTLLDSNKKIELVVKALLLGAILTSAFGLFQFAGDLAGLPQSITGLRDMYTKEVFGFPRVQSTALEPLYFANYLLLPIAIGIVALIRKQRALVPYAAMLLPLALPAFVLTLSRAAYIGAAFLVVILAIALFRHVVKPSYIVLGIVLVVVTFMAVTYALSLTGDQTVSIQTFTRQATDLFGGASFADRASTVSQAWDIIKQNPFGVGPGNFGPAVAIHPLVEPYGGWLIVNNIYLEVWAEEGIVGLLGFLALCIYVFLAVLRTYWGEKDLFRKSLLLAVGAAFVAILAQYMTFSILYIMHIWFCIGLALTLIKPSQKTP